jgi:hypothetical protein
MICPSFRLHSRFDYFMLDRHNLNNKINQLFKKFIYFEKFIKTQSIIRFLKILDEIELNQIKF